jgi:hypothetical protein
VPWTSSSSRCKEPRHGEPCWRASGADTSIMGLGAMRRATPWPGSPQGSVCRGSP